MYKNYIQQGTCKSCHTYFEQELKDALKVRERDKQAKS